MSGIYSVKDIKNRRRRKEFKLKLIIDILNVVSLNDI